MEFQFKVEESGDDVLLAVNRAGAMNEGPATWFAVSIPPSKLRAVADALVEEADARDYASEPAVSASPAGSTPS